MKMTYSMYFFMFFLLALSDLTNFKCKYGKNSIFEKNMCYWLWDVTNWKLLEQLWWNFNMLCVKIHTTNPSKWTFWNFWK